MEKNIVGNIKITAKPLGFVTPLLSDGSMPKIKNRDEDIIIYEENLNCALDRDTVEIEITGKERGRMIGKVLKIVKRNKTKFVGTLIDSPFGLVFSPDDWKFYKKVEIKDLPKEAKAGLKIYTEILDWNNPNLNPEGKLISIIGEKGVHETEMQSILLDKGIVYDFPHDVEEEAQKMAEEFKRDVVSDFKEEDRKDFRGTTTFTIDPKDAKDFDDALSYKDLGDGVLEIGVHIADVSHFVRPGSALDREARKRSFSTYLVDRTVPMLPEVLSNELCSLNPHVDRFAFSSVFKIEANTGKVIDRWFGKTIINSDKRFTYENAQEVLDNKSGEFLEELTTLNNIANIYREENKKNGAIEFETDEVKFELDETGKPIRIYKKPRLDTMRMIEEWMLLANREVAKYISDQSKKRGGASIFRIHDLPKMERIENLAIFVRALGYDLPVKEGAISAKAINRLLKEIEGSPSESLIKTTMIRSMAKAIYSTKNIGHFGLSFEYYTHFTSPIRRYPDLLVHRILQNHLTGGKVDKADIATLQIIADEASDKEITVAEAERESIRYKQVEFMQNKVGQTFDATISGVTEWGMYVEDPETKVEGMVRLKDMEGDFYEIDEKNYCIVGQRTKKKFSLGDKIKVKLVASDLERKTLDFKVV